MTVTTSTGMMGQDLLEEYRENVLTLRELTIMLERVGSTGAPPALRSVSLTAQPRTNDPAAAEYQLADGLTDMIEQRRAELAKLLPVVLRVFSGVSDARTYMVLYLYYIRAMKVEEIAEKLYLSPRTVARVKASGLSRL